MMMRETVVPLIVIALVSGAGWYYREPLKQQLDKSRSSLESLSSVGTQPESVVPAQAAEPTPRKDTIYRWVDENGGVHYDQKPALDSEAVVIDQGRIQSLSQYGEQPKTDASGVPIVEADGDAPKKSLRAIDRFPQAQAAPL